MPRLKHRRAALFATLVVVALGAALAAACAGLFETALRLDAPPQRLAHADAVIAPAEHARLAGSTQPVALTERGHLPSGALDAVRALPGVSRARLVPDLEANRHQRDGQRPLAPPPQRAQATTPSAMSSTATAV
jgi:putative ABC transport system permease protein